MRRTNAPRSPSVCKGMTQGCGHAIVKGLARHELSAKPFRNGVSALPREPRALVFRQQIGRVRRGPSANGSAILWHGNSAKRTLHRRVPSKTRARQRKPLVDCHFTVDAPRNPLATALTAMASHITRASATIRQRIAGTLDPDAVAVPSPSPPRPPHAHRPTHHTNRRPPPRAMTTTTQA